MENKHHPRLEQQTQLLNILRSFKADGRVFTIFDILNIEPQKRLKYGMTNYHLNLLVSEGKLLLLKNRPKKVKHYKFPESIVI